LEDRLAERCVEKLGIRLASVRQEVGTLSGGNQQKVVLGKWLETRPRVLLLDEPTRGVDVGAKHEIYRLLGELAAKGLAILLISTEMPELIGLCDRIVVLHRGSVAATFSREEASPERILAAAMGGAGEATTS
jgi:ABC-type sugar transport system ATPase subunit